jgi:putative ABC transport system substrate-binding protein
VKRREFITLIGGAAAWPFAARAQQQVSKIPRIGIIDDAPMWNAFRQGLRDLGYLEGQNIAFEYRRADGAPERLAEAATDLARRPVDVIATWGPSSIAAKAATTTIPIVMIAVGDVVRTGLVQGLAHPGGNITGNTLLGPEMQPKRLQLFKAAVPSLSRVALLWNPDNASNRLTAEEVRAAAATLSMTFTVVPVRRAEELDGALAAMMLERPDGLMVTGDAIHQLHVGRIINFLANNRLPGLFQYRENVVAGGLMSYGASLPDLFRRAGYVDKILRGTRPADLPVEQPTKFELVVNLRTAKALGLAIPEPFLLLANEINEPSRLHHAPRRRGGVTARGACAAGARRVPRRRVCVHQPTFFWTHSAKGMRGHGYRRRFQQQVAELLKEAVPNVSRVAIFVRRRG